MQSDEEQISYEDMPEYIRNNYFLKELKECKMLLTEIPKEYLTEEMCLIAVKKWYSVLQYIPNELKTEEMCLIAVKKNYYDLIRVPDELKTEEMCLAAMPEIHTVHFIMQHIPIKFRTRKIYEHVILKLGCYSFIKEIPNEFLTADFCLSIIYNDSTVRLCFKYFPQQIFTEKFLIEICDKFPDAIKNIPTNLITKKLIIKYLESPLSCFSVCFTPSTALPKVPIFSVDVSAKHATEITLISHQDEKSLSRDFIEEKIAFSKISLLIDDEICFIALKNNKNNINYIPEKIKTKKFYIQCLKMNLIDLSNIPKHMITEDFLTEL